MKFLSEFTFLSIERVYAVCKLGRWKTSHVRLAGRGMVLSLLGSILLETKDTLKDPLVVHAEFRQDSYISVK